MVGLLFLVVAAVNLIGLLLGKFLARADEVGVRRALGASRRDVFLQHLVECQVVALLGGAIGVAHRRRWRCARLNAFMLDMTTTAPNCSCARPSACCCSRCCCRLSPA